MAKLELYDTVDLPAYAVYYIEYGDSSGLDDEDIANIDEWLETLPPHCTFSYGEESEFTPYPEFGLACDTIETEIWSETK